MAFNDDFFLLKPLPIGHVYSPLYGPVISLDPGVRDPISNTFLLELNNSTTNKFEPVSTKITSAMEDRRDLCGTPIISYPSDMQDDLEHTSLMDPRSFLRACTGKLHRCSRRNCKRVLVVASERVGRGAEMCPCYGWRMHCR